MSGSWRFNVGSERVRNVAAQQVIKLDGPEVSRLTFNTSEQNVVLFFEFLPRAALSNLWRAEVECDDADEGWGRGQLRDQPSAAALTVRRTASSRSNAAPCQAAAVDQTVASYSHLCVLSSKLYCTKLAAFSLSLWWVIVLLLFMNIHCGTRYLFQLSWYRQGLNLDLIYF